MSFRGLTTILRFVNWIVGTYVNSCFSPVRSLVKLINCVRCIIINKLRYLDKRLGLTVRPASGQPTIKTGLKVLTLS